MLNVINVNFLQSSYLTFYENKFENLALIKKIGILKIAPNLKTYKISSVSYWPTAERGRDRNIQQALCTI